MESVVNDDDQKSEAEAEKRKGNMRESAEENEVNHENNDNLISMGTLMSGNNMKDRENLDKSISMGFVEDVELGGKLVPDGKRQSEFYSFFVNLKLIRKR